MRRVIVAGVVLGALLASSIAALGQAATSNDLVFRFGSDPVVEQPVPVIAVRHDLPDTVGWVAQATDVLPAGPRPAWTDAGLTIAERESAAQLTIPWVVNLGATRLDGQYVYPLNLGEVEYSLRDQVDTVTWMASGVDAPSWTLGAAPAVPDLQFALSLTDGSLHGCVGDCAVETVRGQLSHVASAAPFERGFGAPSEAVLPATRAAYVPLSPLGAPSERKAAVVPLDADGSVAAASVGPANLLPALDAGTAALAIAAGLLLLGGPLALYSKIRRDSTLENETRRAIYEAVVATPGLSIQDVARRGDVSHSTAAYHLERLSSAGLVVATGDGNKVRYYRNGGRFTEQERKLLPILENAETVRVLETVMESPWTYRAEIAQKLGVTATTVNWHLKRLFGCGVLSERREGRNAYLFVERASLHVALTGLHEKLAPSPPRDVAAKLLAQLGPVTLPAQMAPAATSSLSVLPPVPPPNAPSTNVTVAGTVYPRLARPGPGPLSFAPRE